jgi:hypothetical protein
MPEIPHCPFCGCVSLWVHLDEYDNAVVECNQCDAVGPRVSQAETSDPEVRKQIAIELWSTRKNPMSGLVYAAGCWTEL